MTLTPLKYHYIFLLIYSNWGAVNIQKIIIMIYNKLIICTRKWVITFSINILEYKAVGSYRVNISNEWWLWLSKIKSSAEYQ
jgi:hypothetical protein